MANYTAAILLSTYNGELYLNEQMDSLIHQKDVDVDIYVRDDGSTDKTIDIIKDYCANNPVIFLDDKESYGPAVSFFELLKAIPDKYDFYVFADQDDIWYENKVKAAVDKLNTNIPMLYCSNQMLYCDGKQVGMRYADNPGTDVIKVIFGNDIAGCTMVLNKQLRDILVDSSNLPSEEILKMRMHDTWVMLIAGVSGKIIYDNSSYINYRIHSHNTVGLKKRSLFEKIRIFLDEKKTHDAWRSRTAQELLKTSVAKEYNDVALLEKIAYYKKRGLLSKISLLRDKEIKRRSKIGIISYFVNTIFGWL